MKDWFFKWLGWVPFSTFMKVKAQEAASNVSLLQQCQILLERQEKEIKELKEKLKQEEQWYFRFQALKALNEKAPPTERKEG